MILLYHGLAGEEIRVVLINELFHPCFPHPEHLGAFILHEGQLLQHDVPGASDLGAQVKLRRLGLALKLYRGQNRRPLTIVSCRFHRQKIRKHTVEHGIKRGS